MAIGRRRLRRDRQIVAEIETVVFDAAGDVVRALAGGVAQATDPDADAQVDDEAVGMGGLRFVRPGVVEVKRVYVRPVHRGKDLGNTILRRLLADAASFGYHTIWLDSGTFMKSAHRLYEAHGFVDCPAYPEAEVPQAFHHSALYLFVFVAVACALQQGVAQAASFGRDA